MRFRNLEGRWDAASDDDEITRMFASLASMEGLPHNHVARPLSLSTRFAAAVAAGYPGVALSATCAAAAVLLAQHYRVPPMLLCLLVGMAMNFAQRDDRFLPGIDFSSRTLLRCGVAVLGLRLTFGQLLSVGVLPWALVPVAVLSTIVVGIAAGRLLGLRRSLGWVSGCAVAICGASAALAVASMLPREKHLERDVVTVVAIVSVLSALAMMLYPVLAIHLGMDSGNAGVFLGGSIHDVAQVVGAGFSMSSETGNVATLVKLLRVAMLMPVVIVVAVCFRRTHSTERGSLQRAFPLFLLCFVAFFGLRNTGVVPSVLIDAANVVSQACLAMAIAALGIKTPLRGLAAGGWRPFALIVLETVWIATVMAAGVIWL
jgi:uncharacterized integral membrane protein (TIGR00698 family)